ncbi:hypothetical protein AB0J38_17260 [Streptomyces sp. NPDC050095]|uniref:hypothetical protein n=1 Tax=unclassified Streptomyces TaxID=2593676 RepID=UPI0034445EA0
MADPQDTSASRSTESEEAPEHVPGQEEATALPEGDPEISAEDSDADDETGRDESGLPDWARAELASVRKEAAKYRVAAKELRESLARAKSPEEFDAAAARVAELESDLHRERLARKYQLPDAWAGRITGDTDEAREADAKELADVFHTRSVPIGRGGLDPSERPTTPKDPAALAGLIPRRR